MINLNPTRVIARRGRDAMIIGALALMAGIAIAGFGVLIALVFTSAIFGIIFLSIGGLAFLVGLGFLIRGLTYRMENDLAKAVAETLGRELDGRFTFLRNVSRNRLGYIDAVLVGPPGALVFRITDAKGIYLNEGADWLERQGGQNFVLSKLNVTRECVTDIYALRDYFARHRLNNIPVYGVVVFNSPEAQLTARQPVVPIAELRTLTTVLRHDYLVQDRIDAGTVDQAIKAIYD